MKLARYDIERNENVLAFSRQVGAIQRNFGLNRDKFLKDHEGAYGKLVQQAVAQSFKGTRSLAYGHNQKLGYYRAQGARFANLQRKDVQQTERMQASNRKLLSMQNKALTRRGLAPIPGVAPAAPVAPSMLEWGWNTASQAASMYAGFS
tara:strand:- start:3147 stop:3593 length:447 start_codon:yes stop_codon:yes gene_type:complete